MRTAWLPLAAAAALTISPALTAQEADSAVIARFREAVTTTSDTLELLRGVAQAFRNDLATASPNLVLTRANQVQNACTNGASALRRLEGILAARTVKESVARIQAQFRGIAEETAGALDRCARAWQPLPRTDDRADTLRAWGPSRVADLERTLRRYDSARHAFWGAAGLEPPHPEPPK